MRELDYFIEITGYAKYLEQRETVWFHAFLLCMCAKEIVNNKNIVKKWEIYH